MTKNVDFCLDNWGHAKVGQSVDAQQRTSLIFKIENCNPNNQ